MPKTTRKYPSEQKTTTKEGYNEYKKYQMRDKRNQEKRVRHEIKNLGLFQMENW